MATINADFRCYKVSLVCYNSLLSAAELKMAKQALINPIQQYAGVLFTVGYLQHYSG